MQTSLLGLLLQSTEIHGDLRAIGTLPPDFAVDAEGTMVGQDFVLDTRLRTGLEIKMEQFSIVTEGDLLTGQILGDAWDLEGDIHRRHPETVALWTGNSAVLRKGYLSGDLASVNILAGLNTNHWGLGMVANNGETQPIFGRNDYGDRTVQLQLSSNIGDSLFLSIAGLGVIEDDMASYSDGQRALQSSNAIVYQIAEGQMMGALFVYRWQREADLKRETEGYIVDVFGAHEASISEHSVSFGYEAAMIQGDTSRFSNYNHREELVISSKAIASEMKWASPKENLGIVLRGGYASGDGNPDDGVINDFSFDRDFNAGMLLFDYYQSAIEVGLYNELTDPDNSGTPPDGVEAAVTEGSIRRSSFFQPVLISRPLPWLTVKAGAVFAWATAPISHGFLSYRNGGVAVNHLGVATEGYSLGTEINWGIAIDGQHWSEVAPNFEIQGGHLMTSEDNGTDEVLSMIAVQGNYRF